jgi:hypothetical protein
MLELFAKKASDVLKDFMNKKKKPVDTTKVN